MTARTVTNLLAVTANTTGAWVPLIDPQTKHALQVLLTGAPSGGTVTIEGSLDGATGFTLATFTIGTNASGDIVFAADKPVPFVRSKLAGLTGGTSPTVTAYLTSSR